MKPSKTFIRTKKIYHLTPTFIRESLQEHHDDQAIMNTFLRRSTLLVKACMLASLWYGSTLSLPKEALDFLTKNNYHQRILSVSTNGFNTLLALAKKHLAAETIKKLEHSLDDTQRLLMSDENNIVIVMVWNELEKNMLTHLVNVKKLKKHHLDKVNSLLKEFQQWLTTYAEAHHSEGLIVQEVYHFIELYRSLAADSAIIPYGGVTDRLEYVGHKCIEWSPQIILGLSGLGLVLFFRRKKNNPPLHTSDDLYTCSNCTRPTSAYHSLIRDLHQQGAVFKPLGKDSNEIKKEFTATLEALTDKQKKLTTLSPLLRTTFFSHIYKVKTEMELHMIPDDELLFCFAHSEVIQTQRAIINVLIRRYAGDHEKKGKLEALKKGLAEKGPKDMAATLETIFPKNA